MSESNVPWDTLFSLLFMSMGPIHAVAVFARLGESDDDPAVRALADRSLKLLAIAFTLAVFLGNELIGAWGIKLPALVGAAGVILIVLPLHSILRAGHADRPGTDISEMPAAQVVFPGLFPPIAIALPIIFAAATPDLVGKMIILGLGAIILALNWLALRYAKATVARIGHTPFDLIGAIFAVLQIALGIQFVIDAWRML